MTNKQNFVKDINVPSKEQTNDSLKNSDKNFNENCTHNKEQIIINDVDVSECEYLTYELEEDGKYYWFCKIASTGGPDECEYNPKCFYKKILKQLARKTQECEQKEKEINELHLIIDRLLEASGYDKNISTAEDFEDVYADIDYKLGLIDDLKQKCEELEEEYEKLQNTWIKQSKVLSCKNKSIEALKKAVLLKENNRYIQSCLTQEKQLEYEKLLNKLNRGVVMPTSEPEVINLTDRYRKSLEEIEEIVKRRNYLDYSELLDDILDIINKAKGGEDER